MRTFKAFNDLDLKSKVVSFTDETIEIPEDLNPDVHRGYSTLSSPSNHQDKYFTVWV